MSAAEGPVFTETLLLARLRELLARTPDRAYVAPPLTRKELAALVELLERRIGSPGAEV